MSQMQSGRSALLPLLAIAIGAAALVVGILALTDGDDDANRGAAVTGDAVPSQASAQAYTVWLVDQALARYERDGLEDTLDYYNSAESVDGPWYVFVLDSEGIIVGHYDDSVRGKPLSGPIGTDITGYEFGRAMVAADEQGRWVTYVFNNPQTGEAQRKHSWVIRRDGRIFGSGWYDFSSFTVPSKTDAAHYSIWLVQQAVHRYQRDGAEAMIEHYNKPESLDGSWYVFVLEDRGGDLYTVANANRPDLLETTRERIDANGFNYGAAFAATVDGGPGEWVSYLFTHPETREDAPKHTWVIRRGNYVIGAGWYVGIEAE